MEVSIMKKKWMYYAACGLALFGLAACSSNESADGGSSDKGDGGSLVVYSPNSEGLMEQLFLPVKKNMELRLNSFRPELVNSSKN